MFESPFKKVKGLQLFYKDTPTQVFSCEYYEMLKNSFFYVIPPVAASDYCSKRLVRDSKIFFVELSSQ